MITKDGLEKMALHIVSNHATVRQTAKVFGMSKTSVHLHMTVFLRKYDRDLSEQVANIFAYHKSVKHLRGGEATRKRWEQV